MLAIKRMIPNLLTAGNLVCGMLSIICILTTCFDYQRSLWFIVLALIFDFLDGFVARLLNVQSELGKQLDSLADMVTFGVAPGIMMMVFLKETYINFYGYEEVPNLAVTIIKYGPYFGLVFPVFALFRLAKFNLDTRQSDSFIGLPTPAATIFLAILPVLTMNVNDNAVKEWIAYEVLLNPIVLVALITVISILMVSEIPLFALKFKHFKPKGNEIRYIFLTISVLLLATLFMWAVPLIIILYIILSLINNAIKPKHEV